MTLSFAYVKQKFRIGKVVSKKANIEFYHGPLEQLCVVKVVVTTVT
jgi:hypothetical protein